MLDILFGSQSAAKVLCYFQEHDRGYATEIAQNLHIPLNMVQKQLEKFTRGQILCSSYEGRIKWYEWNETWPFYRLLRKLLWHQNSVRVNQSQDPADGTHLPVSERLRLSEELTEQAELLNPYARHEPFIATFDSMEKYEAWRKKQKSPWLA